MLCVNVAGDRFDELRQLCTATGDKASLAIGMAGLVMEHAFQDRIRDASHVASEAMALIESVGDPTLTVVYGKVESGQWSDVLRWSQRVVHLADGDPSKGSLLVGSPLALALTTRAMARYSLGRAGWRDDMHRGLAMARSADPMSWARQPQLDPGTCLRSVCPTKENRGMDEYWHVAEDEWEAGMRDCRPGDPGRALDRLQRAMAGADR